MFATTLLLHLWALSVSAGTCVTYGPVGYYHPQIELYNSYEQSLFMTSPAIPNFSLTSFVNGVNGVTYNGLATFNALKNYAKIFPTIFHWILKTSIFSTCFGIVQLKNAAD